MKNLVSLNFEGKVYPVNPRENMIFGLKAYARLKDIPDRIDLVISAVPAPRTMDIVRECGDLGIENLVIVTGGFSEGGELGKKLHGEIASFVKEKGIRTLGPNTLTPINTANNLAISFHNIKRMRRGGLSFAFQSGFYEPKFSWLFSHLGINKMLDMGNKIDINEVDALEYFSRDPDTKVIAMHLESIQGKGQEFFDILGKVSREKPTIILKTGRTPGGSRAAASHTGSMARENDTIFDHLIRQTGAIRAQGIEEFFDLAKAFEFLDLPKGKRLAIITMSGGEGVMATDACEMNGLRLASLSEHTHERLRKIFPPWEIPLNPFDTGACLEFRMSDLMGLFETLMAIPEDDGVDCSVLQMPPDIYDFIFSGSNSPGQVVNSLIERIPQGLVNLKKAGKPFAMWLSTMEPNEGKLVEILESHGVPVFRSSERAIKALAAMARYRIQIS
jgi:acetyltransferase